MLLYLIEPFLQFIQKFLFHFFGQLSCIGLPVLQKILCIYFSWIQMLVNKAVQLRLRKLGFIAFIVAMPAIAYHIYKEIGIEFLAVKRSNLCSFYNRFG